MSIFDTERQRRSAAQLEAQRQEAKRQRDEALNAMTYTFADGAVVQVRPGDLPNFQTAISRGSARNWVLADNTTRMTTVSELQEALEYGIVQGEIIWDHYMNQLEAIL